MIPAIQLTSDHDRITNQQIITAAVSTCWHDLSGAERAVWKNPQCQVVEQAYDLPDVYVSYLEIQVYAPHTYLPIRCPQSDLYWLYLLRGALDIVSGDRTKTLVTTSENHYRVSYLPAGRYACLFRQGTHRIFYVVHKPVALFREESPELGIEIDVMHAVKAKLNTHATSSALSMRDGSAESIRRFLHVPGQTYLKRRQAVAHLSLELVFIAYDTLLGQATGKAVGAEWAGRIKIYIDECVVEGTPVNIGIVARHFGISPVYARRLFKTYQATTIGHYLTQQKLAQAERLLKKGERPAMVARYIGWTPAYFSRKFKEWFGVSPKDYSA